MDTLSQLVESKQPLLYKQLSTVFKKQVLSHAYLIEGPEEQDLSDIAMWMTQGLYCESLSEVGSPCGICRMCSRIKSMDHADISYLEPDGQTIKVDQMRQIKQFFMNSGIESSKKVLIIKEAEKMTNQAANSLLKFIEEPDGQTYIFLLTKNVNSLLPTIQSRCQILRLKDLPKKTLNQLFDEHSVEAVNRPILLELTHSIDKSVELSTDEWFNVSRELIQKWSDYLQDKDTRSFVFVHQNLVKHAKDKEQQHLILDMLLILTQLNLRVQLKEDSKKSNHSISMIELITEAKEKLTANVGFQSVCEQLSWRIIVTH